MTARQTPRYLLRPANPYFIALSFFVALMWNLFPWGYAYWVPDMFALVLLFWNIRQPRKVSIGTAFFLGLLVDIQNGAVLGQHALAYSLLSYFAIILHHRELWINRITRALYIVLLLLLAKLVPLIVTLLVKGQLPDWFSLFAVVIEALLWPVVSTLLLVPQRRPEDVDTTRPF